jgi:GAF domain-containing protein
VSTGPSLNEIAVIFGRVKGFLLTAETARDAVEQLAQAAKDVIPEALGAGVTLISKGERTSTGATDDLVRALDDLQYELQEGPCLAASSSGQAVRVDDAADDDRWPRWAAAAAALPVRSCLSVPLLRGDRRLGAMKVYAAEPNAFNKQTELLLKRLAASAAALLGHVQTAETPQRISRELAVALTSRDTIGLAKGILMVVPLFLDARINRASACSSVIP